MKKRFFIIAIILSTAFIFSCSSPIPFLGTWQDSDGNKFVFESEGTFEGSVYNASGNTLEEVSGAYYVSDNTIVFMQQDKTTHNEIWEIDGGIFYLSWTDTEGQKVEDMLQLFRTKKN